MKRIFMLIKGKQIENENAKKLKLKLRNVFSLFKARRIGEAQQLKTNKITFLLCCGEKNVIFSEQLKHFDKNIKIETTCKKILPFFCVNQRNMFLESIKC